MSLKAKSIWLLIIILLSITLVSIGDIYTQNLTGVYFADNTDPNYRGFIRDESFPYYKIAISNGIVNQTVGNDQYQNIEYGLILGDIDNYQFSQAWSVDIETRFGVILTFSVAKPTGGIITNSFQFDPWNGSDNVVFYNIDSFSVSKDWKTVTIDQEINLTDGNWVFNTYGDHLATVNFNGQEHPAKNGSGGVCNNYDPKMNQFPHVCPLMYQKFTPPSVERNFPLDGDTEIIVTK